MPRQGKSKRKGADRGADRISTDILATPSKRFRFNIDEFNNEKETSSRGGIAHSLHTPAPAEGAPGSAVVCAKKPAYSRSLRTFVPLLDYTHDSASLLLTDKYKECASFRSDKKLLTIIVADPQRNEIVVKMLNNAENNTIFLSLKVGTTYACEFPGVCLKHDNEGWAETRLCKHVFLTRATENTFKEVESLVHLSYVCAIAKTKTFQYLIEAESSAFTGQGRLLS